MLTEQNGIQVDKFYPPTDWQYSFPEGYTRLEYIESTGTQYINTNIIPTLNTKVRVKFSPTVITTTGYFGSRNDPYRFCCTTFSSGTKFTFAVTNNVWSNNKTDLVLNQIYDCVAENGKQIINGNEYNETVVENWGNAGNFYLSLVMSSGTQHSSAKYYLCQIWESGVLVRNLVPVKRNSDNKPGMYDLVNDVFYVNQGTGEFVMGHELYSNNSQIDIRQKNNTNFVEKYKFNANNELIWANPQLNLSGPVNYSVVGSPTIVDGVVSGFSSSNYLTIPHIPENTSFELNIVFDCSSYTEAIGLYRLGASAFRGVLETTASNKLRFSYRTTDSSTTKYHSFSYNLNEKIKYNMKFDNNSKTLQSIAIQNNIIIDNITLSNINGSEYWYIFQLGYTRNAGWNGNVYMNETYVKVNDKLWFYGKNYTSENYAPVPAGLNYNNTTTPSIGYVNTQTQEFIPAPTDGIKYSQTRDIKVIPPEDNTITLLYGMQTQESHHLPSEYEELVAIQSSGTQWIDTGISGVSTFYIDTQGTLDNTTSQIILGRESSGSNFFGQMGSTKKWGLATSVVFNLSYLNRAFFKVEFNSNEIAVTYNENRLSRSTGEISLTNNIYLFGANSSNKYLAGAKVYSVKAYNSNNELVRDLIPARRKSDSEVGMYDLVEGEFLENQGTGTFTAVELKYKLFGLLAQVSSGTYDVYIDDVLYATTASETQTDIDFSALGSEYVSIGTCTTPEELVLHKIVIKPTTSGATITKFGCYRHSSLSSGIYQQGNLWCHFELDNTINIVTCFCKEASVTNAILYAVTAKNNKLLVTTRTNSTTSGIYSFVGNCNKLVYLPILEFSNNNYTGGTYLVFNNVPTKRIIIKNNDKLVLNFLRLCQSEKLEIENPIKLQSSTANGNNANFARNLKLLPKTIKDDTTTTLLAQEYTSLYPTKIDDSLSINREYLNIAGTSSYPARGLRGLKVSNEAPFTGTSPQINVSYTGLDRDALIELFESMPGFMKLTKVGEPTIDSNGVVSGFSSSNYLELQNTITLSKDSNIEIIEKINKPSNKESNSFIGTAVRYGFTLQGASSGKLRLYIGNGSTWSVTGNNGQVGTNILDINTDYYIKIKISNSLFNVYISTDNINYTLDNSIDISALMTEEQYNLRLGMARNTNNYFNGSIDLKNSYIKINNARYQFQLPDDTTTRAINITAATGNNLTKVGTPTIDENGVASGFSANNYLSMPTFTDIGENLEICICIIANTSQNRAFLGVSNNYSAERPFFNISSSKIGFKIRKDLSIQSNYTISLNTYYKAILKRINNIYTLLIYDINNNLLNSVMIESSDLIGNGVSQNFIFGADKSTYGNAFAGSIDLESTYIKVDNNYLMKGYLLDSDRAIVTNKGWSITE